MRLLHAALLALACPLMAAAQAQGIGAEAARHLLNRTGFDAQLETITEYAQLSRRESVERVLANAHPVARGRPPAWIDDWQSPRRMRQASAEERMAFQAEQFRRGVELKNWWVAELLTTPSPLAERMTLFWHNHFTSGLQKVRSPNLMYRQNVLLRRHALGNFAQLLHAVSKDPAMLVYLDSATSRRGQPNENFAREVMELFTLGEGRYREGDIKEAARAFTGWSVDPDSGEFLWRPFAHDDGVKHVLGRSGNLRGEDVLDQLLAQAATAEFVTAKLWREFISPAPRDDAERRDASRIAARFRDSGYDIKSALRELFGAEAFWQAENRAALVKSPVDLVIGTVRQLEVDFTDPLPFTLLLRQLGQDLFAPPNVRGWPGGESWINATTLLARKALTERLLREDEGPGEARMVERPAPGLGRLGMQGRERFTKAVGDIRFHARDWLRQFDGHPGALQLVLLPGVPAREASGDARGLELARALLADPMYQLK